MTFSVRTGLVAVSILALLLGALVSQSPIFIEIAAALFGLAIPLSLVFAICDHSKNRRSFWVGFLVMSLSTYWFVSQWGMLSNYSYLIAETLCGSPKTDETSVASLQPPFANYQMPTIPASSNSTPQPNVFPVYATPLPTFQPTTLVSSSYSTSLNLIVDFCPVLFATIAGIIGGALGVWISRSPTHAPHETKLNNA